MTTTRFYFFDSRRYGVNVSSRTAYVDKGTWKEARRNDFKSTKRNETKRNDREHNYSFPKFIYLFTFDVIVLKKCTFVKWKRISSHVSVVFPNRHIKNRTFLPYGNCFRFEKCNRKECIRPNFLVPCCGYSLFAFCFQLPRS